MKTRSTSVYTSLIRTSPVKVIFLSLLLGGCSSIPNIVPQLPLPGSSNSPAPVGQDIAQANNFLAAGQRREAANAYFSAAQNYGSPERERLILQAAELAANFKDSTLTQEYLAPLNYDQLSPENQARFRLTQAQLALNDRNYRETLRILPQRVNNLPEELGQKILSTRLSAAQSSGDKLALVQELVLQEPTLKESYQVSLNHDRIWNHAQQIPAFQLEEAKNSISHPIVKNWLNLAQLSRISKNGPASKRQTLRSDLGRWIQSNTNHPGMLKALDLLNAAPTTTVTPYSVATKQLKSPPKNNVKPQAPVKKQIAVKPIPTVKPQPSTKVQPKTAPSTKPKVTPYSLIKKQLNLP